MNTLEESARALQYALELIGVVAFAISGAMAGIRKNLDWFGVIVLGWVVAVGGGTLRDVVLGLPAWWLEQPWQMLLAAVTSMSVLVVARDRGEGIDSWRAVVLADAVGLAVFAALGTDTALQAGTAAWAAVALGVLTGTGGGVIRDVLVGRPPMVLTGQIYALAALAGVSVQVVLVTAGANAWWAIWSSVAVTASARILAIRLDWNLPIATAAGGADGSGSDSAPAPD